MKAKIENKAPSPFRESPASDFSDILIPPLLILHL
jgi:hypothetical protein